MKDIQIAPGDSKIFHNRGSLEEVFGEEIEEEKKWWSLKKIFEVEKGKW